MVIYRPGVGRVYAAGRSQLGPYEGEPGTGKPHPGYDPLSGEAIQGIVIDRITHPGGLTVELYGDPATETSAPSEVLKPPPEPVIAPPPPAGPPRDWRDDYGLARIT